MAKLDFIGKVTIPSTTESFVVSENFICNTGWNAKVKISFLNDGFNEWFFGKIEEPMAEKDLCYAKSSWSLTDTEIIAELGGEARAKTTLTDMFTLMERQSNVKKGELFTDGRANIFYVRDKNGVLRVVFCRWSTDGWRVFTGSIESSYTHDDVHQVFFRNSVA